MDKKDMPEAMQTLCGDIEWNVNRIKVSMDNLAQLRKKVANLYAWVEETTAEVMPDVDDERHLQARDDDRHAEDARAAVRRALATLTGNGRVGRVDLPEFDPATATGHPTPSNPLG